MRRILSDYNADRPDLFTRVGFIHLKNAAVSSSDRLVLDLLRDEWEAHNVQLQAIGKRLREFAADAPAREAEARAVLDTIPGVGFVTVDVVVNELGDIRLFGSQQKIVRLCGAGSRWARIGRSSQAVGHHQGRVETASLGLGRSGLAVGASHESMANHL